MIRAHLEKEGLHRQVVDIDYMRIYLFPTKFLGGLLD